MFTAAVVFQWLIAYSFGVFSLHERVSIRRFVGGATAMPGIFLLSFPIPYPTALNWRFCRDAVIPFSGDLAMNKHREVCCSYLQVAKTCDAGIYARETFASCFHLLGDNLFHHGTCRLVLYYVPGSHTNRFVDNDDATAGAACM
jgi:hypothetical protein